MRIDRNTVSPAFRDPSQGIGKKRGGENAGLASPTSTAAASATEKLAVAPAAAASSAPNSPGRIEHFAPPGLSAVQARLQAMNTEDQLSKGQQRALEVINRNLERYLANQGAAPVPVPTTETTA